MNGLIDSFIREPKSIQRLGRAFAENLTARDLAEPLLSLDANQPARMAAELMRSRNVPVLGVRREGLIAGWICPPDLKGGTLGEHAREFRPDTILEANASCQSILVRLQSEQQLFVAWLGEIAGIITQRDLQKPPMRMWIFGAITTLDSNLTWAVRKLHPNGSWHSRISPGRYEKAAHLHAERTRRGNHCDLVDCLQIKDKTDILTQDKESLTALGLASRNEAERVTRGIEKLRNNLAHAQELQESDLALAARLASGIGVILAAEGTQRLIALKESKTATSPTPAL